MTAEESELHQTKWRRIRRVKRWLRPLPRRANIHRYPILRWFSKGARKRAYIWSFRSKNAVPAIYAGCILTFMPIYGIQIPTALVLALLLRANLPILASLQMVSNPLTAVPLWLADYQIGRTVLGIFGIEMRPLNRSELKAMLDSFTHGDWGNRFENLSTVFSVTSLGALVLGVFFGLIGSVTYRIIAKRTATSYALIRDKLHHHKQCQTPFNPDI
ncbi:MAG: DUF2062 domain-containing protein [Opitutales bacterium]